MGTDGSTAPRLERHILDTYFFLRLGVGLLALSFPVLLWAGGELLVNTPLQESMSAYYHTGMRNVFVGVLIATGFYLILYKGFSRYEDWALNIAALLAVGIAIFPMNVAWNIGCGISGDTSCLEDRFKPFMAGHVHGTCAALFFLAIGYVSIFRSGETLYLVENKEHRTYYRHIYRTLGVWMLLFPGIAWALFTFAHQGVPGSKNYSVFFVELAGVWVFAAYWLTKTHELRSTEGDKKFVPPYLRPREET